jgi:hypothetical protein
LHTTQSTTADHDHFGVLGDVDQSGHIWTGNDAMANGNVACVGDGVGCDAHRVTNDLFGSPVTLCQVVLRDGYIDPRADLRRRQNMDINGTPRSAASRAAQSVATRDTSDPSTPTTIPWIFDSEGPGVDVISLSLDRRRPADQFTQQTLSGR